MSHEQVVNDELVKIEKWFAGAYKDNRNTPEDIQLLILYKLHQLDERLQAIEHQTRTHWVN